MPNEGVGVITLTNGAEADTEAVALKVVGALLATGGLARRAPALSPAFAGAVDRLLGVMANWDEAAYAAMLTKGRPHYPKEKEELARYRERHGACHGWKPLDIEAPTRATLALECERGAFDMTVSLGPDGLISGFSGTSRDVAIPADERKAADAIARLVGQWDEALYRRHLARAFPKRDEVVAFYERARKRYGACSARSAEDAAFDRTILLSCERGPGLRLALTLDEKDRAVVRGYTLRPAPSSATCPVR